MECLDLRWFQNEIAQTRSDLVILWRSLDESLVSWRNYGFANVPNPVAVSLRRDIKEREAVLRHAEHKLADVAG
jgi:hypothetical protein